MNIAHEGTTIVGSMFMVKKNSIHVWGLVADLQLSIFLPLVKKSYTIGGEDSFTPSGGIFDQFFGKSIVLPDPLLPRIAVISPVLA